MARGKKITIKRIDLEKRCGEREEHQGHQDAFMRELCQEHGVQPGKCERTYNHRTGEIVIEQLDD